MSPHRRQIVCHAIDYTQPIQRLTACCERAGHEEGLWLGLKYLESIITVLRQETEIFGEEASSLCETLQCDTTGSMFFNDLTEMFDIPGPALVEMPCLATRRCQRPMMLDSIRGRREFSEVH